MQYTDQREIRLERASLKPLGVIMSPRDLEIDPDWEEIISPVDPRVRELFLRPLCLAAQYERSCYLMLPDALTLCRDNGFKISLEQEFGVEDQVLYRKFLSREQITQKDWEKYQSGRISLTKYQKTLNANSAFVHQQIKEDNLLQKFATANLIRERLNECYLKGVQILKDQNLSVETYLKLENFDTASIKAFEGAIKMPLRMLIGIKHDIDTVRAKVEPLKSRFLELNSRLVRSAADTKKLRGLEFDDLVSVGKMGMLVALENFDFDRKLQFSTYAYLWINQGILREIKNNYHLGVAVPHNMQADYTRIAKQIYAHLADHNARPTTKELSEVTGMSEQHIKTVLGIPREHFSLDEPSILNHEEKGSRRDLISDDSSLRDIREREIWDRYEVFIEKLQLLINQDHQKLLAHRFNLGWETRGIELPHQSGEELGITKERVRQVNIATLKALSSYAVLSEVPTRKILELVKDRISPVGFLLLSNILQTKPEPVSSLIHSGLVSKKFPIYPYPNLSQAEREEVSINKVLGLTRSIVINLANTIVWHSLDEDKSVLFQEEFNRNEEALFTAYVSDFYESYKSFSWTNKEKLADLGFNISSGVIPRILERIEHSIMPVLRSRYFRQQELY